MKHYNEMFIWENIKNTELLFDYRNLVVSYFNTVNYGDSFDFNLYDTPESQKVRSEINMKSAAVMKALLSAGIRPVIHYSPPPAVGGMSGNIDLINNLFNLRRFDIPPQSVIDFVEKAIGIYNADCNNARNRTINPFYWLFLLLNLIIHIPFFILEKIGFNRTKIEGSLIGRLFKGIAFLSALILGIIQILEKLGLLDTLKHQLGIT